MARIRSVKPEFWTGEHITQLSRDARLFFIGLWNFSDDQGISLDKPRQLKSQIFPEDDDVDVPGYIAELIEHGRIVRATTTDGRAVLVIKNFRRHQKPQHPTPSKFTLVDNQNGQKSLTRDFTSSHEDSGALSKNSGGVGVGVGIGEVTTSALNNSHDETGEFLNPHEDSGNLVNLVDRQELTDAVFTACQIDTEGVTDKARDAYRSAINDLSRVGATPDQVFDRSIVYRQRFPNSTLTPKALVRHWPELNPDRPLNMAGAR